MYRGLQVVEPRFSPPMNDEWRHRTGTLRFPASGSSWTTAAEVHSPVRENRCAI